MKNWNKKYFGKGDQEFFDSSFSLCNKDFPRGSGRGILERFSGRVVEDPVTVTREPRGSILRWTKQTEHWLKKGRLSAVL